VIPGPASTYEEEAGASRRRRLPAQKRRLVIYDAALRTFAAKGYDGASMDEIAAAAGVSKAVVYDHVASKRALYDALLEAIRRDLVTVVETALAPEGLAGESRVRAAADAFYRYVAENVDACRLLFIELQGANVTAIGRELEERMTETIAVTLGADTRLFDKHPERLRQLQILAELLKSGALGLAMWWVRHPETPREELVDGTVAVVWPAIDRGRSGLRG
jgi:AcrR family transcriptional regulator